MNRCLYLARQGKGYTSPNPMVGSVIVYGDRIIGEGYHRYFGGPHAEVYAVDSVKEKNLLKDSVLYVNLEPCSHSGKTPPCADMIIKYGIPKLVSGTTDPNPLIAGKGLDKLNSAGIITVNGIMAEECEYLNRRFFTFHKKKRPYIILKWAQTNDGFIDVIRDIDKLERPLWISNPVSKMLVHKWRSEEQAILVGTNTAYMDDPELNVREWPGKSPVRMVIDRNLRLPESLKIFNRKSETWIFNEKLEKTDANLRYIKIDFNKLIKELTEYLYSENILSLIIEGGKQLAQSFIDSGIWDEARVFEGRIVFNKGVSAPLIHGIIPEETHIQNDRLLIYRNF